MERISLILNYVGSKLKYIGDILDHIKYTIKIYFTCFYFVNLFNVARKLTELYMWLRSESHFVCVHREKQERERRKKKFYYLIYIFI